MRLETSFNAPAFNAGIGFKMRAILEAQPFPF
jgi:hypothetical protein